MDVSRLIGRFNTSPSGTYAVTRRSNPGYTAGRAGAPSTTSLTIVASATPATGRDLQRLPEGRRAIETKRLITTTLLLVGGQGDANNADLVAIDGRTWEVQHVETWHQAANPNDADAYSVLVQALAVG